MKIPTITAAYMVTAMTGLGLLVAVMIAYTLTLGTGADASHTVKRQLPGISAEVAGMSADRLGLDQAQTQELHDALLANPPRVSCEETTDGHDTVFRSETAAQCFLSYNVREPVRYKARAQYQVRFEDEINS